MEKEKQEPAVKYERVTLIAAAASFDTAPELMAGALHGATGTLTREQAEKRLAVFLTREVNG